MNKRRGHRDEGRERSGEEESREAMEVKVRTLASTLRWGPLAGCEQLRDALRLSVWKTAALQIDERRARMDVRRPI